MATPTRNSYDSMDGNDPSCLCDAMVPCPKHDPPAEVSAFHDRRPATKPAKRKR